MVKVGNDALLLSDIIVEAIKSKKGIDIVKMDLRNIPNRVCDCFIVCHGTSNVHINTIKEGIIEEVRKSLSEKPWHYEGNTNSEWILLDYSNVVVHIFLEKARKFYDIESLWADADITRFNE